MGPLGPCRQAPAGMTLGLLLRRLSRDRPRKATAMKIRFTREPTITKAVIATAVFTLLFLVTPSSLPSCSSDPYAALNAGGCIVRQSYLHTACGWLALASLITGVVLVILKQRKAPAKAGQAPSRPAWSGAPRPAGAS